MMVVVVLLVLGGRDKRRETRSGKRGGNAFVD